jgi:hypothetical protein
MISYCIFLNFFTTLLILIKKASVFSDKLLSVCFIVMRFYGNQEICFRVLPFLGILFCPLHAEESWTFAILGDTQWASEDVRLLKVLAILFAFRR